MDVICWCFVILAFVNFAWWILCGMYRRQAEASEANLERTRDQRDRCRDHVDNLSREIGELRKENMRIRGLAINILEQDGGE